MCQAQCADFTIFAPIDSTAGGPLTEVHRPRARQDTDVVGTPAYDPYRTQRPFGLRTRGRAAWPAGLLAKDAATSRTQTRKRSTTGLRVRFLSVTIRAEKNGFVGKSTGSVATAKWSALMRRTTEVKNVVRYGPAASKRARSTMDTAVILGLGAVNPCARNISPTCA